MKSSTDGRPLKPQAIVEAEKRRIKQAGESSVRRSMLAVAYELFFLIRKHPDIQSHIQNMAYEQYNIAWSLGEKSLADLFFDISEHDCYCQIDGADKALSNLSNHMKSTAKELNLPPQITADQKQLLDENSLPILSKMVRNPESSVEYFYELVEKLDELVQAGELGWQFAFSEVYHTLDRPQIYTHKPLEPAIVVAYELSAQYEKTSWDDFVALVRESKQNIKGVDKK